MYGLKSIDINLEKLQLFIHAIRPHQIVYQLSLVLVSIFFIGSYSIFQLISSLLVILLITPTFLLLNDILHLKDDEKVGQKRVLMGNRANFFFFVINFSLISIILYVNNINALVFYIFLFFSSLLYGYAKSRRHMYISYAGRIFCGISAFLLYYSIFSNNYQGIFTITIIIGLYDLIGNIAGDLRDKEKDEFIGVKTLVTCYGEEMTIRTMRYLTIIVYTILSFYLAIELLIVMFIVNMSLFIYIDRIVPKYRHGLIHGFKCMLFVFLSGMIMHIDLFILIVDTLGIGMLWLIAYYFYLSKIRKSIDEKIIQFPLSKESEYSFHFKYQPSRFRGKIPSILSKDE